MGKEDFEFLKFRALESLEIAEKLFRDKHYNFAAFHIEQFFQFSLKYLIGISTETF